MKIRTSRFAVLAAALLVPVAALPAGPTMQTQNATPKQKRLTVQCEVVTGTHIARTKAEECGKAVRAYGSISRDEMERGTTPYRLQEGVLRP
jgi:hypothetical protein